MLNKDKVRELAYLVKVDSITPMDADRLECAHVGGWNCVVGKGEFSAGDPTVYFEIDSQLPDVEPFSSMEFLKSKRFKIKSQKIRGVISQGLLMPVSAFGWTIQANGTIQCDTNEVHCVDDESRFLTKKLGVTYAASEDNERKKTNDRYMSMTARHKRIFKTKIGKWFMQREWGRKFMFAIFGRKRDKATGFPTKFPFVKVTDEERVENMPQILQDKEPWIKTQKIDGTSSTYILERKRFGRFEQYVCSRNVRQLTPNQKNYHKDIEGNVYWMMAEKYHIFDFLKRYLIENKLDYVCLQGETAGPNIQGNPHRFKKIYFFGYNLIRSDVGRINSVEAKNICEPNGIFWVPIEDEAYILPDDMETLKLDADGPCVVGQGPREGWVYRSQDGQRSFKNVSRQYLLKHSVN